MKAHTSSFKEQIKLMGKEIDSKITFGGTVLGKDDLNAVTPSYQGAILKSVMKQLDIDSNAAIPIGTILKYEFGLKVNGEYEYINYGNYVVYSIEKQEDTNSYKITCYDKLLYSMLGYVKLPITYPISIRDYINVMSTALGLTFANKSETFANYDKQIQADLYDGLGYTFRDVLDELAQVTASTICLNNNDELEIRYITETSDIIDEEFLKDVNVNFGEKFGSVNTIVLSRSADSDSVYYPEVLPANPYEIKISDNQIMNGNDRADFLPDIYNKLNGLEFYTNDFVSTGICYYDLCDRYSVKVGDNTYSCVMFNDEVLVTQGLEENIYTELPEQTETDYKHASKDDRMINQVYIIAKKNEAEILALVSTTETIQKEINPTKDESGSEIIIEDASNNPLTYLEIEGRSTQETRSGKNLIQTKEIGISELTVERQVDGSFIINGTISELKFAQAVNMETNLQSGTYTLSVVDEANNHYAGDLYLDSTYKFKNNTNNLTFSTTESVTNIRFNLYFPPKTYTNTRIYLQLEEGSTATEYEQYGVMPSPDYPSEIESVGYENLFDENYYNNTSIYTKGTNYYAYVEMPNSFKTKFYANGFLTGISKNLVFGFSDSNTSITTRILNNGVLNKNVEYDFTNSDKVYFIVGNSNTITIETDIALIFNNYSIQVTKNMHNGYIPYGKYGIEVETVGKNLLDASVYNANNYISQLLTLKAGTYTVHYTGEVSSAIYIRKADNVTPINGTVVAEGYNRNIFTFTISELGMYYIQFYKSGTGFTSFSNATLNKGTVVLDYKPFQKNTSLIVLNAPLRSLPNGVKDIAYIKNNKLYVDRYVGSTVLNGSENWYRSLLTENKYYFQYAPSINQQTINGKNLMCSHFKPKNSWSEQVVGMWFDRNMIITTTGSLSGTETLDEFKAWLSTHNTQVDYELATPVTEELGEIEMLKTLKGYNDILTTDELLPIINLTYVRDTILADYVENHVAELKLTENEIKTSVESVSSSVDGLNTSINRVEEITNDNSQVINIISTNIDKTSGEVREVTTTTGFTFNANGMTIDDGSGFKAEHTANGTYYKDGNSIVGQYTKDGSKQKDLELFGTYSYGKESIDDTPMFVGQLYTDENGEECFGHFVNI